jgi:steroid 5-alpha reductase family enzyme
MIHYGFYHWASWKNNVVATNNWALLTMVLGMTAQWWVLVSRVSRNLIFDGMLYGVLLCINYALIMACLGEGSKFQWWQWLGVTVVIIGFTLIKLEFK